MAHPSKWLSAGTTVACLLLAACSDQAATAPTPTIVQTVPPARPTRTPRPTPEIRDDQQRVLSGNSESPAAADAGVSLTVRGVQLIRTKAGGLEGLGEVYNGTPETRARVQVRMNLLDKDGATILGKTILIAREHIGPGQTSPFRVHFDDVPTSMQSVDVVALPGEPIDASRFAVVQATNIMSTANGQLLTIRGELVNGMPPIEYVVADGDTLLGIAAKIGMSVEEITRNNPEITAETLQIGSTLMVNVAASNIELFSTAYDRENRVIGFRKFNLETILPEQNSKAPFEIAFTTASSDIAGFSMFVNASK